SRGRPRPPTPEPAARPTATAAATPRAATGPGAGNNDACQPSPCGSTTLRYCSPPSRSSAARSLIADSGPAARLITMPVNTSTLVANTIGRLVNPVPTVTSSLGSASGNGSRSAPQKALTQIRVTAYNVRKLVSTAAAVAGYAHTVALSAPARNSVILAMNPENGGMPARFSAGTANNTATSGALLATPDISRSETVPVRRVTRPLTRNNAACTVMWWTT